MRRKITELSVTSTLITIKYAHPTDADAETIVEDIPVAAISGPLMEQYTAVNASTSYPDPNVDSNNLFLLTIPVQAEKFITIDYRDIESQTFLSVTELRNYILSNAGLV